jgi:hypothetical protein
MDNSPLPCLCTKEERCIMHTMYWCGDCKSNHTVEFGFQFHDRILKDRDEA